MLNALKARTRKGGGPAPFAPRTIWLDLHPLLAGFGGLFPACAGRPAADVEYPGSDPRRGVLLRHAARIRAGRRAVLHVRPGARRRRRTARSIIPRATRHSWCRWRIRTATSCQNLALSMVPGGPAGRFPDVAAHGWGIPTASKNKDAAWEFITWAMSKQIAAAHVPRKGL